MPETGPIWQRLHMAFEAHRRRPNDVDAQTAFERVAQKSLGLSERTAFNSTNCTVREEEFGPADLQDLKLYHPRTSPQRADGPIVIIEIGETRTVIDGNNRVNAWKARKAPGPFVAIIVTPLSGTRR
jgi:hypothetical protein